LSDKYEDEQYSLLEDKEFLPFKDDMMHKIISYCLRYPNTLDLLGVDKTDWIIEVIQKFNMISILNYMFREALSFLGPNDL
jgi:hypothetical protein